MKKPSKKKQSEAPVQSEQSATPLRWLGTPGLDLTDLVCALQALDHHDDPSAFERTHYLFASTRFRQMGELDAKAIAKDSRSLRIIATYWNSKAAADIRAILDVEERTRIFAGWLCIHMSTPGGDCLDWAAAGDRNESAPTPWDTPYLRVVSMVRRRGVGPSPKEQRGAELLVQRGARAREAVQAIVSTARRLSGERIAFDARALLGAVLDDPDVSRIAIGIEGRLVFIPIKTLREAARALKSFAEVAAALDTSGEVARLVLRWSRGDGRVGGLELLSERAEEAPPEDGDLCVVLPAYVPWQDEPDLASVERPAWSTYDYINASMDAQRMRENDPAERERREREQKKLEAAGKREADERRKRAGKTAEASQAKEPPKSKRARQDAPRAEEVRAPAPVEQVAAVVGVAPVVATASAPIAASSTRTDAARKAWETRRARAAGVAPAPPSQVRAKPTGDQAAARTSAALKAWETRRLRAAQAGAAA